MKIDTLVVDEFDGRCVKIYNPEKKELIGVFQNFKRAEIKLNIGSKVLRQKAISKKRIYCEVLKMEIAVRVSNCGEEEKKLIEQTNKNKSLV
jgi:hypothetical protein